MFPRLFASGCLVFIGLAAIASAQVPYGQGDWPQWRGPNRDGHSNDKGLLKEWPEDGPPVLWKIDTVGVGYSSISIKDGRIYTQGDLDGVEHVICLSAKDGTTLWAVQPEPVKQQLEERVAEETKRLDGDANGSIDELEALARFGFKFNDFDHATAGEVQEIAAARMKRLFLALDKDNDGQLTPEETGRSFYDEFERIDRPGEGADAAKMAESRSAAWLAQFDVDSDKTISRDEARNNIVDRYFGRMDQRDPETNKGDDRLTAEEIRGYFLDREAGKDGTIGAAEMQEYYASRWPGRDGLLTADDVKGYFGGLRDGQGDGPRGTPTIDGDRIYVEGGMGDLTCLDAQTGRTIWHVNLPSDFGGGRPGWGFSESPLVEGNMLIVTPGGKEGTLMALDKRTGEKLWRSGEIEERAHYSSPVAADVQGVRTIVQFASQNLFGVDASDGKLLWTYSNANNGTANCSTPVVDDNCVFASSAYGTGGGLAKISRDGNGQRADEVYFDKQMANHHGGIVKVGDYIYGFGNAGLMCLDFKTGELKWKARSAGKGSLCYADGMFYLLGEGHQVALAEATFQEYREHGKFKIESHGRPSWAHPVVAGGVLYIRDQNTLTAYDVSKH